jgi:hypothetical protein
VCDDIIACGGHPWKYLMYFSFVKINATVDANFQLSLRWINHAVSWFYSAGNVSQRAAYFQAPPQENPAFNAGWLGSTPTPSPGGFPFFQFGIMSSYPIRQEGWRASVSCPSILEDSTWICIHHADLLQGDQSFWKAIWRWGEPYNNVGATVNPGERKMTFEYSPGTFQSFQVAW